MRVTRNRLRRIIQEELERTLREESESGAEVPPQEVTTNVKKYLGGRRDFGTKSKGSGVVVTKFEADAAANRGWKIDATVDTVDDDDLVRKVTNIVSQYLSTHHLGGKNAEPADGYFSGSWKFTFADGQLQ